MLTLIFSLPSFATDKNKVVISGHHLLNYSIYGPSAGTMKTIYPAIQNMFDLPNLVNVWPRDRITFSQLSFNECLFKTFLENI